MSVSVPIWQVLEHQATMRAMLFGLIRASWPFSKKHRQDVQVNRWLLAPSYPLTQHFQTWLKQPVTASVPMPLVVSQTVLAVVSELTAYCPYPLLNVLNQGLSVVIQHPIQAGQKLRLAGRLVDASDDGYRARIHSQVQVFDAVGLALLQVDAYAAVVLAARPASTKPAADVVSWSTIATWQAAADEGVTFFLLTGDFNPIHTLPLLARHTRFKGCIMHGYGAFAQIYAVLSVRAPISAIETRFVNPLPLPSPLLQIQIADLCVEGKQGFRLIDQTGKVYQMGHYQIEELA